MKKATQEKATIRERERVNRTAAAVLALVKSLPENLPSDHNDGTAGAWEFTNMLWHAREIMESSMKMYVRKRGDPATFKPAKPLKKIESGVKFYLVANPSYLNE